MDISEAPATRAPYRLPMRFVGSGSEYFRIWIVNLLLTLVTLGLYYPFAKARRLRYFYGCTEVGGQPLSFHGNPRKMLEGYLIVIAAFALYSVAHQVSPPAAAIAGLAIALAWPALWRASLRFRLGSSGWRGLRASFAGSLRGAYRVFLPLAGAVALLLAASVLGAALGRAGPAAAFSALAAPLLVFAALPWLYWRLKRYQHGHYRFASEQSRFEVPLRSAYAVYLKIAGIGLLVLLASIVLALAIGVALRQPDDASRAVRPGAGVVVALPAGLLLLEVVVRSYAVSRVQNLVWNGTRSEHLRFESALRFAGLAGLSLRNTLLTIVTLGLFHPFALVSTVRLRIEAMTVVSTVDPATLFSAESAQPAAAAGDAAIDALGFDIGL